MTDERKYEIIQSMNNADLTIEEVIDTLSADDCKLWARFFNWTELIIDPTKMYLINLIENRLHELNITLNADKDFEPLSAYTHAFLSNVIYQSQKHLIKKLT